MAKYSIEESTLKSIADAIREKEGSTDDIPVADMAARIGGLEGGGGGASMETCTMTIDTVNSTIYVYGTNKDGAFSVYISNRSQVSVLKNSMVSLFGFSGTLQESGDIELLFAAPFPVRYYSVTGDCTITIA